MGLINEYIDKLKKERGVNFLERELFRLIEKYNEIRDSYLFVYSSAIGKPIPSVQLEQSDYYTIFDLLNGIKNTTKVDIYIETPGGSGETAEEIVRFLRNKFDEVSFVVSGEAKSAGTIMVLSGDEILMTETGSLGPIDAQIKIGRSIVSAYDYIEWVEEKREESEKQGKLNPFDAIMTAQITPGELGSVFHAFKFAEDLVVEWLSKYKFKKWEITQTHKKPVTEEMKKERAKEIVDALTNHSKWRLHGRSIKINDLEEIGLQIIKIDDNPQLADIVYRIQTICRLIFENTSIFKVFATKENKIFRQAVSMTAPIKFPVYESKNCTAATFEQKCPRCAKIWKIYANLSNDRKVESELISKGYISFPKECKIICDCGYEIDLMGIKNEIESQIGKSIIIQDKDK